MPLSVYLGNRLQESYQKLTASSRAMLLLVLISAWFKFGGKTIVRNGKIINMFPSFVYNLAQNTMYPINWLICSWCYLQPDKSEWNEPDQEVSRIEVMAKVPGKPLDEVKERILSGENGGYTETDLVRLYDSLPAAPTEEYLVGRSFKGRVLRTGRSVLDVAHWALVFPLQCLGFDWGKRYLDQHTGDPLLVNWMKIFYFPIPVWGNVGVADIKWRGVNTGTMNYDHQPWKDYFRVLRHNRETGEIDLLGVWTSQDKAGGWFTLRYDPSVPTH